MRHDRLRAAPGPWTMTRHFWHEHIARVLPCGHGEDATVCASTPLTVMCQCPVGLRYRPKMLPCPGCAGPIELVDRVGGTADCVCGFRAPFVVRPPPLRQRPNSWKRRRQAVYDRDGGRCRVCAADVPRDAFEVDHIIPRASGGPDTLDNLQTICGPCHRLKTNVDSARGANDRRRGR